MSCAFYMSLTERPIDADCLRACVIVQAHTLMQPLGRIHMRARTHNTRSYVACSVQPMTAWRSGVGFSHSSRSRAADSIMIMLSLPSNEPDHFNATSVVSSVAYAAGLARIPRTFLGSAFVHFQLWPADVCMSARTRMGPCCTCWCTGDRRRDGRHREPVHGLPLAALASTHSRVITALAPLPTCSMAKMELQLTAWSILHELQLRVS